ncbi:MAG: hypothetical protein V3V01_13995 [Acidimicrobiales bacterium]
MPRLLIIAGYVGMAASLIGIVIVWLLLDDLGKGVDQSLELTTETLATLDETLVLGGNISATVSSSAVTLDNTITRLSESVEESSDALGGMAELSRTEIPDSIDGVVEGIDNLTGVARTIDATLDQLSSLPFGPNYDPADSFADTLVEIRDNLEPTATVLREIAPDLKELAEAVDDSQSDLAQLSVDIDRLRQDLDATEPLIADYRDRVKDAQQLAAATQGDLQRDRRLAKAVALVLGLALAIGQLVPILYGRDRRTE